MKTIALALAAIFLVGSQASFAQESCGGCAELVILEKKFSLLKEGEDEKAIPLLNEASSAVKRMPTQKGKKLTKPQLRAVSKLLAAAYPNDPDYAIIDNNFGLFKANEKEFFSEFKTLPKKDAENLESSLGIKMGEAKNGQG